MNSSSTELQLHVCTNLRPADCARASCGQAGMKLLKELREAYPHAECKIAPCLGGCSSGPTARVHGLGIDRIICHANLEKIRSILEKTDK